MRKKKAYTSFQCVLLERGVMFLGYNPLMIEDGAAASSATSIKHIWKFPGNAVKGTDISCNFRKHFISPLLLLSLGGKRGEGKRGRCITIE